MEKITTLRRVIAALGTGLALVALSVGQALASGGSGPFPK